MKMTNEEVKKILDGAPEGATHYTIISTQAFYFKDDQYGFFFHDDKKWRLDYVGDFGVTESLSDLREILELRQKVERLKAQLPKWVSVDERLPDSGVQVLCFGGLLTDLGFTHQTDFAVYAGNDKDWLFFDGTISDGWSITHWMPLPQPAKEQDHE